MSKKDKKLLYLEQQNKCTDENVEALLFSDGLKLTDYYIDERSDTICFIDENGVLMDWLIEDDMFAQYCRDYLRRKGVKTLQR